MFYMIKLLDSRVRASFVECFERSAIESVLKPFFLRSLVRLFM